MLTGLMFVGVGTLLLYYGATFLVKGSSGLARALGVAPAVIGLTVVAFGTSLPELVVTVTAALKGNSDLAIGNVVGSNIANIGLILGACAAVHSLKVEFTLLKREVPMGVGAMALLVLLSLDGVIGRGDGLILLAGFVCFIYWSVAIERKAPEDVQETFDQNLAAEESKGKNGMFTLMGLVGVLAGGHFMVEGGVSVAENLGVAPVIIGLSVVAVGTSLPELAASFMAALKGEDDIGVGGVLGSNLFNILGVLGATALIDPIKVPASFFGFQYPILALFTVAIFPIAWTGRGISRFEGVLLLCGYAAYITFLFV